MASRVYIFDVTVPAGTAEASPVTSDVSFPVGLLDAVEIQIPDGSVGLVGVQLLGAHQPFLPINPDGWLRGNDLDRRWNLTDAVQSGQWELRAYNTDSFDHTVQVRLLVDEPGALDGFVSAPGGAIVPVGPREPVERELPEVDPEEPAVVDEIADWPADVLEQLIAAGIDPEDALTVLDELSSQLGDLLGILGALRDSLETMVDQNNATAAGIQGLRGEIGQLRGEVANLAAQVGAPPPAAPPAAPTPPPTTGGGALTLTTGETIVREGPQYGQVIPTQAAAEAAVGAGTTADRITAPLPGGGIYVGPATGYQQAVKRDRQRGGGGRGGRGGRGRGRRGRR